MIGESPRHEKLTMGRVWIGPNGMIGPPWWRSDRDQRTRRRGTRVVHLDDLIARRMIPDPEDETP